MTAQGKMTAAGLAAAYAKGQALRILVEHEDPEFAARFGWEPNIIPATRKTGVVTVLITGTEVGMYRTGVGGRAQRVYRFATSIGHIQAVPAQTFILAPEDPAGIKRAHVEALELDQEWERMAHLMATPEAPVTEQADGGVTEVTEQVKPFRPVVTAEPGTPCGWKHTDPDHGTTLCGDLAKNNAVHVLTQDLPVAKAGTALCAYHSPFDPTPEERAAVTPVYPVTPMAGGSLLIVETPAGPGIPVGPGLVELEGGVLFQVPPPKAHVFQLSYSGMVCDAMVEAADGTGDVCGRAASDPVHIQVREDSMDAKVRQALTVEYPPGTPEYAEYARRLRAELARFAAGEGEYARQDAAWTPAQDRALQRSLGMDAGDREAARRHLTLVKDPAPSLAVERPQVVKGDVVTIHKGTRYYDVLRTSEEYARVCPVDPMDHRDPEWVSFDLLHVVPPVCEVTVKFGTYPWSAEAFRLEGNGWDTDRPVMARIKMLQVDPQRLARPTIVRAAGVPTTEAVGVLRIGSAITIQGRTFQVVWDGGPGEPRLEPSSVRGRMIPRQA